MNSSNESRMPSYGGQALIEGVLMRGRNFVVAAFQTPDGSIHIEEEKLDSIFKTKIFRIPFLRGLAVLWDSLFLGMKYLTLSANIQTGEEEQLEGASLVITLVISISFSIGLFFVLPSLIISLFSVWFNLSAGTINLGEGFVRLLILVFYLWVIGKSNEISRVFAYHGAEHKTINAFEDNVSLSIHKIKDYPLSHTRCGTSFLLTLILISVIIFSILGPMELWVRIVTRILMVPFIAMISYEVIKWMGDNSDNVIVKMLSFPNLFLQKLTTREPDEKMIKIALAAFNKLLKLEIA